jgi:hypothetical protein
MHPHTPDPDNGAFADEFVGEFGARHEEHAVRRRVDVADLSGDSDAIEFRCVRVHRYSVIAVMEKFT